MEFSALDGNSCILTTWDLVKLMCDSVLPEGL